MESFKKEKQNMPEPEKIKPGAAREAAENISQPEEIKSEVPAPAPESEGNEEDILAVELDRIASERAAKEEAAKKEKEAETFTKLSEEGERFRYSSPEDAAAADVLATKAARVFAKKAKVLGEILGEENSREALLKNMILGELDPEDAGLQTLLEESEEELKNGLKYMAGELSEQIDRILAIASSNDPKYTFLKLVDSGDLLLSPAELKPILDEIAQKGIDLLLDLVLQESYQKADAAYEAEKMANEELRQKVGKVTRLARGERRWKRRAEEEEKTVGATILKKREKTKIIKSALAKYEADKESEAFLKRLMENEEELAEIEKKLSKTQAEDLHFQIEALKKEEKERALREATEKMRREAEKQKIAQIRSLWEASDAGEGLENEIRSFLKSRGEIEPEEFSLMPELAGKIGKMISLLGELEGLAKITGRERRIISREPIEIKKTKASREEEKELFISIEDLLKAKSAERKKEKEERGQEKLQRKELGEKQTRALNGLKMFILKNIGPGKLTEKDKDSLDEIASRMSFLEKRIAPKPLPKEVFKSEIGDLRKAVKISLGLISSEEALASLQNLQQLKPKRFAASEAELEQKEKQTAPAKKEKEGSPVPKKRERGNK